MKNPLILLIVLAFLVSCKNDKTSNGDAIKETTIAEDGKTLKQSDGFIAIQGNFLYSEKDKAAVLQTPTQMFGVVIDEKMQELNKQVQQYKSLDTDMVPVTLRGRIFKKEAGTEGWDNIIEIKEILKVTKPNPIENEVIKVGSK